MSATFLAGLVVASRPCVVIGDDREAADKTRRLLDAGARLTVFAAHPCESLAVQLARPGVVHVPRGGTVEDAGGAFVVVFTPQDREMAQALHARGLEAGGPLVCCIDQPAFCTLTNVAVVERGALQIGIGSSGAVPMLAARLRAAFERDLGADFTAFVDRLATLREATEPALRRDAMREALDGFDAHLAWHAPAREPTDGGTGIATGGPAWRGR